MTSASSWQNYESLPCFIAHSKAKYACYARYFLTSYFGIPVPYNEKDIFFWVLVLKGLLVLHTECPKLMVLNCGVEDF